MNRRTAFTLIEILLVVIILGILATVALPYFTSASGDAREAALATDLRALRGQVELYKSQHGERYPGVAEDGSFSATLFRNQLTLRTNSFGDIGDDPTQYPLGPYLQIFPTNPFAVANRDEIIGTAGDPDGGGNPGWHFDTSSGAVAPNDADHVNL